MKKPTTQTSRHNPNPSFLSPSPPSNFNLTMNSADPAVPEECYQLIQSVTKLLTDASSRWEDNKGAMKELCGRVSLYAKELATDLEGKKKKKKKEEDDPRAEEQTRPASDRDWSRATVSERKFTNTLELKLKHDAAQRRAIYVFSTDEEAFLLGLALWCTTWQNAQRIQRGTLRSCTKSIDNHTAKSVLRALSNRIGSSTDLWKADIKKTLKKREFSNEYSSVGGPMKKRREK